MKEKKSLRERFNGLSNSKKIQVIIAAILTVVFLVGISSFAWFSLKSSIENLTKVKSPTMIDIRSGHGYSIEHLDLSNIDAANVDAQGFGYKDYIFAVKAGSNISEYDIQIAHTTNIPFTYTLYRAIELGNSSVNNSVPEGNVATFEYYNAISNETITYYYGYASNTASPSTPDEDKLVTLSEDAILILTDVNPDSVNASHYNRTLGEKYDGSDSVYSDYSKYIEANGDDPEIYAVPLYSQHRNIRKWSNDLDFYILRLSWNTNNDSTAFAEWNAAANNKETDIIYISAKSSSGGSQQNEP